MAYHALNFASEELRLIMEQIYTWKEFMKRRRLLNARLAEVAATCWHPNRVIQVGEHYRQITPEAFTLKDKRHFYKAARELLEKEVLLHLYMGAARCLPGEVGRYAAECGFNGYRDTRISYEWRRDALACCTYDNYVMFSFYFVLFGHERRITGTILHELCHTVHHHHRLPFWQLLEQKLKMSGLVGQDYDGWDKKMLHIAESQMPMPEFLFQRLYHIPSAWCVPMYVPCCSEDDYEAGHWSYFYIETFSTLKRIIRKKLNECRQDGSLETYRRLYGVDESVFFC